MKLGVGTVPLVAKESRDHILAFNLVADHLVADHHQGIGTGLQRHLRGASNLGCS